MQIYNLVVEVTRKCNMSCQHCLRGDAQNKEISEETMKGFLIKNQVTYISMITFTGGEPSLNPKAIAQFIQCCKDRGIEIGSFYIATNGKAVSDEFVKVCMELYLFCSENEDMSSVDISQSPYHLDQDKEAMRKLKCLTFVKEKEMLDYRYVIAEGRGKELAELNGTIDDARKIKAGKLEFSGEDIQEGEVYLNVKGDIVTACDLSYARQNRLKLGHYSQGTIMELAKLKGLYSEELGGDTK